MNWSFHSNEDPSSQWKVPSVSGYKFAPLIFAENELGNRIGYFSRRDYIANFVFQNHGNEFTINFSLEARFFVIGESIDLAGVRDKIDRATLSVGFIIAMGQLSVTQKNVFLSTVSDIHVFNEIFKRQNMRLYSEINHIDIAPFVYRQLDRRPEKPKDNR